ncbi:MAG: flavin reductase family protein [Lachnospiraceae bacterium]|nr:flavin reductase family protein [Lachnospiraceae bacterium]
MSKEIWKPGNLLYPLPAVLVSVTDGEGNDNVLTVAWTGTICSDPAMVYISVRKERHSYEMIKKTGEFVINLTTEKLLEATDHCGVRSGKDEDKFEVCGLHKETAKYVKAPLIKESPLNLECEVTEIKELGSHDMFMANVLAVDVSPELLDEKGTLRLDKANLIAYSHGRYYSLGEELGTFGYSVRKK